LSNSSNARKTIKSTNFGLHYDDYYSKKKSDDKDYELHRKSMLAHDFRPSYLNDHTPGVARSNPDSFLASALHNFDSYLTTSPQA
jgi:hypothetical protein